MPRKPQDKPWRHAASGYWCITLNGRRVDLDTDFKPACRKLVSLRREAKQPRRQPRTGWISRSRLDKVRV
jgi:hypothetical protein